MSRTRRRHLLFALAAATLTLVPAPHRAAARLPGEEMTPAGVRRDTAVYVPMRDGTEIAVEVLLPASHRRGDRWPVLLRPTRYWRAAQRGWGLRLLAALHLIKAENLVDAQRDSFNRRGFAVVVADARGSGASGGQRVVELSPDEIADMGEVATWAARQPWSNGRVGTFGVSYDGDAAELAAAASSPALRAVMPLYADFDSQALLEPGGVLLRGFVQPWSDGVRALDRDDVCAAAGVGGLRCWWARQVVPGVKRVDADPRGDHLRALVAQHQNLDVATAVGAAEFSDDRLRTPGAEIGFGDISAFGWRRQIEASAVPMMVWCGWMDAGTCDGALIRYRTFANPQILVIGPLSHGGAWNADPLAGTHQPPVPPRPEQYAMQADFFARLLRHDPPDPIASIIRYYTMGEGAWHTTPTWPPAGLEPTRLYLAADRRLASAPPAAAATADPAAAGDTYQVDFSASSGTRTRWHTQLGGGDVVYADRAGEDRKLLVYTGPPLATDLEITGSPILTLVIASTAADGAVHAYLEDVAADGRVTYLDEGVFRLLHRREVDPATLPYAPLGPAHSFRRADAAPLVPGEAVTVRFALYPTSLLLRRGHRLRLALAGADAGLFQRYPATGAVTWTIHREPGRASFLEIPARAR
jgi:putative CocE/NonD family hydrolase